MRGKVLGHPLTTYNPRLPLIGDRMMLLGDAKKMTENIVKAL